MNYYDDGPADRAWYIHLERQRERARAQEWAKTYQQVQHQAYVNDTPPSTQIGGCLSLAILGLALAFCIFGSCGVMQLSSWFFTGH